MCFDCQSSGSGAVGPVIGGVVGLLLSLLSSGGIIFALIKKGIIANPCSGNATPALQAPPNGVPEKLMQAGNKAGVTNGAANGHPEGESLMSNGNGHMHENGMNGAPATA